MKKIICISLALLTVFSLIACSREPGEAPVGMKNAAGSVCDFYLYVPNDWTVTSSDTDLMAAARVSDGDSSSLTMIGYSDAEDDYHSIDAYWSYYVSSIKDTVFDTITDSETSETKSSFTLTTNGTETRIDECSAKKYEYSGQIAGVSLSYMQIIVKRSNVFYIITYTSTPELYDRHSEEIMTVLNFIEFK